MTILFEKNYWDEFHGVFFNENLIEPLRFPDQTSFLRLTES